MKRYPAFDPPEYVGWSPDPALVEEYRKRVEGDPERAAVVAGLDRDSLLGLYRDLLRTRIHDIALKRWVRTGVISKAWLGTGEEAVTVGSVAPLRRRPTGAPEGTEDVVSPMIRNAGALHMMGVPLADLFRGYLATADSPTGGRDLHIGAPRLGVIQPISHMGTSVPVLAGVALAFRTHRQDRVALTWVGDGATRTAAFHEGVNLAAVRDLPLVVVIQNNQVALGTTLEQHGAGELDRIPDAYGIPSWRADGNNVLDVLAATRLAIDRCRSGEGPAVVVADTFRMGGHATHDEREAREAFPPELFEEWGRREPVGLFEAFLLDEGVERGALESVEDEVVREMDRAATTALESREKTPAPEDALYRGFSDGGTLAGLRSRLDPSAPGSV